MFGFAVDFLSFRKMNCLNGLMHMLKMVAKFIVGQLGACSEISFFGELLDVGSLVSCKITSSSRRSNPKPFEPYIIFVNP